MATSEERSKKMSSVAGATLRLVALAGLLGSLDAVARRWTALFCISLRVATETLPAISVAAWQISVPYLLGYLRLLEGILQITASCWQLFVSLARVA